MPGLGTLPNTVRLVIAASFRGHGRYDYRTATLGQFYKFVGLSGVGRSVCGYLYPGGYVTKA